MQNNAGQMRIISHGDKFNNSFGYRLIHCAQGPSAAVQNMPQGNIPDIHELAASNVSIT